MLKIRLTRRGRHNVAIYRIVVAEKDAPIKGAFQEILGHYNPILRSKQIEVKQDRIKYWISKGAIPTPTVASLLKNLGMESMEKYLTKPSKKRGKKKETAAEAKKPQENKEEVKKVKEEPKEEKVEEKVKEEETKSE
ncbi:30S ribosomal protein S16 [Candidatus Peregrinibacteria bacterium RIFOXYB2_FULL_32_7]|nr:MAG: 30S ribosomal protein S16 [Candidatus Peregrinibacteria bacterium RIFOXYB2_FULL_32_7]